MNKFLLISGKFAICMVITNQIIGLSLPQITSLQSCSIYSLHCSTCDSNDNILPTSWGKSSMWCHIIIDLFSLIVEDHILWFVDAKLYIFDASSWFARGEIDWEVKVVIICLRHEVFLQSEKFGLQLFIWNTVGFCCIALSLPLKRLK